MGAISRWVRWAGRYGGEIAHKGDLAACSNAESGWRSRLDLDHENYKYNRIRSGPCRPDAPLWRGRHHTSLGRSDRTIAAADAPQSDCRGGRNDHRIHCKRGDARSFRASPTKIAWLLGYQDVSAFTNAFKRWTGMTFVRPFEAGSVRRKAENLVLPSILPLQIAQV
jgi:AraC-like DNA-binding protein